MIDNIASLPAWQLQEIEGLVQQTCQLWNALLPQFHSCYEQAGESVQRKEQSMVQSATCFKYKLR